MVLLHLILGSIIPTGSIEDHGDVKLNWEFRSRFERRNDRDFAAAGHDDLSQLFSRIRLGTTYSGKNWEAHLQLQYAHLMNWGEAGNWSSENFETSLLYFRILEGSSKWTIGRQKIALGDQRLLGPLDWANQARSFDGVRLQSGSFDAAFFGIGVSANRPVDARVGYFSYDSDLGKSSYLVKLDRGSGGDTKVHTINHIWKGRFGSSQLGAEIAGQFGQVGGKDLSAFAVHFGARTPVTGNLDIEVEANLASGGQSAGHTKTFDNLYPTNHLFYGSADMVGWKNMQELSVAGHYAVSLDCKLKLAFRKFWLFDATDGWYGAGGGLNKFSGGSFIDPTGASGKDLGSEFDFEFSKNLGAGGSVSAGVAWFIPGPFVKRQVGVGSRIQTWGYLSYGVRF